MAILLTSAKNPRIKEAAELLEKRRAREESQTFAVEGAREAARALKSGLKLLRLFTCPPLATAATREFLALAMPEVTLAEVYDVPPSVFAKLAIRDGSDGVFAVFRQRHRTFAEIKWPEAPLILAVHGVEKPGNLGALLRTADGVGIDAVVLLDGTVDLYNPHVVRGSVGAVFGLEVVAASSAEFRTLCKARGIRTVAAALSDKAKLHFDESYTGGTAILLGSEADGLPEEWVHGADACVRIPMRGVADSLNVSVAGAVLLYEAVRQRR